MCRSHFKQTVQEQQAANDKCVHPGTRLHMSQTGGVAFPRPTQGDATPASSTLLYSRELSNIHTATYRRARSISSRTELPIFAALSVVTGTTLFVLASPTCSITFGGRTHPTFGCLFPLMGRSEESHRLKGVLTNSGSLKSGHSRQQSGRQ